MSRAPILVLGCGSIGRRHISNLTALGRTVLAYDTAEDRRRWVREHLKVETVDSVAAGLARRPAAAFICTPPSAHAEPGLLALRSGVPAFIEKPLAAGLADGRKLAASGNIPAAVGYQLRFHPALRWIKSRLDRKAWGRLLFLRAEFGQYLPDWRPWQNYRRSYTARKALGGGILLDASHELDLVRWLAGEARSVFCLAKRLALPVDVEDTAALLLEMRSGAIAEVHLDMVQRGFRRGLLLSCAEATVTFELPASRVTIATGPGKSVVKNFPFQSNDLYLAQTKAFLRRLGDASSDGLVSPRDALKTLALVETARKSARTGRKERIL